MPRAPRRSAVAPAPVRARATALPPEERRAAIVEATVPLLLAHGPAVTTRQIAEAAGIAEGTIFRVFPDKDAVISAAVEAAFDPLPLMAALRNIDRSLPLEERLVRAVELIQRRVTGIWQLLAAVGVHRAPDLQKAHRHTEHGALAELFDADGDTLRYPADQAAQMLRALTLACSHPALATGGVTMPPADIVSVLLDGIRARPSPAAGAPKGRRRPAR